MKSTKILLCVLLFLLSLGGCAQPVDEDITDGNPAVEENTGKNNMAENPDAENVTENTDGDSTVKDPAEDNTAENSDLDNTAADTAGDDTDSNPAAEKPVFDISAYSECFGLSKADALQALGITEENLVEDLDNREQGWYLWEGKTIRFGTLDFPVSLRFVKAYDASEEDEALYLSAVLLKHPIDADTMDYEVMWNCFTEIQDTLMRQCGRPRTYRDTDFTTDIHWAGQIDPETEFGYEDYWLVSEKAYFPGAEEKYGGVVSAAMFHLVNNLEEGREDSRYILLRIGLRAYDTISGPRLAGEFQAIFIYKAKYFSM